jgi:hypothetical protein
MFVSATIVREIAMFGGDVSSFVHPIVLARLAAKVAHGVNLILPMALIITDECINCDVCEPSA